MSFKPLIYSFRGYNVGSLTQLSYFTLFRSGNSQVEIGDESIIHCRFGLDRADAVISIGSRTFIGRSNIVAASKVTIGNNVLISWGVNIVDHDSHSMEFQFRQNDVKDLLIGKKNWSNIKVAPVVIEDGVWIGFNASILKGVTVGERSIIAAGSLVTKDVPPATLVAGSPAKVIKVLNEDLG